MTELETKDIANLFSPVAQPGPKPSPWIGYAILASVVLFVLSGLYVYLIRPALAKEIPAHSALPLDSPPLELTSFEIRTAGEDLTPQRLAISGDSLFVSFSGKSFIEVYSSKLQLLKTIRLDNPATLHPTAIVLTDSLLIVADTLLGTIAVFDRDGFYLNSASWYPDRLTRLKPVHLTVHDRFLYATDMARHRVAKISLFKDEPFFDFLELISIYPSQLSSAVTLPLCAAVAPNGNLWIGDGQPGGVFLCTDEVKFEIAAEKPVKSRIVMPSEIAIQTFPGDSAASRIHVLDRVAGKVLVYDIEGKLRLVYPRDRNLHRPTGMVIEPRSRHIFVAENETREITVFGY